MSKEKKSAFISTHASEDGAPLKILRGGRTSRKKRNPRGERGGCLGKKTFVKTGKKTHQKGKEHYRPGTENLEVPKTVKGDEKGGRWRSR